MEAGESGGESETEWEEVNSQVSQQVAVEEGQESHAQGAAGGIEITVPTHGDDKGKGKRKGGDAAAALARAVAAFERESRLRLHQTHLLCLLCRGVRLSQQCDDPTLQAVLLSMLGVAGSTRELILDNPSGHSNITLTKLLTWFRKECGHLGTVVRGVGCGLGTSGSDESEVQLLVGLLRAIGLRCRLVLVLHPLSLKPRPSPSAATPSKKKAGKGGKEKRSAGDRGIKEKREERRVGGRRAGGEKEGDRMGKGKRGSSERGGEEKGRRRGEGRGAGGRRGGEGREVGGVKEDSKRGKGPRTKGRGNISDKDTAEIKPGKPNKGKSGAVARSLSSSGEGDSIGFGEKLLQFNLQKGLLKSTSQEEMEQDDVMKETLSPKASGSRGIKRTRRKAQSTSQVEMSVSSPYFTQQPGKGLAEGGAKRKRSASQKGKDSQAPTPRKARKLAEPKKLSERPESPEFVAEDHEKEDSDDEFKVTRKKRRSRLPKATPIKKLKQAMINEKQKQEVSVSDEPSTSSLPSSSGGVKGEVLGAEVEVLGREETGSWAEVYLPSRKKWVCLHLSSGTVDQPQYCERHCTVPLRYVLAFEKSTVRDVTARYASDWMTVGRKQRVDQGWWEESLRPYQSHDLMETMQENETILSKLQSQPLPVSIAEYKNHPLYALRRHLLKFQALYPEDSPVLGHCKGEPVYSRSNIHTLHTRDTWLKEGRLVRVSEQAYRKVKARPKKGQSSSEVEMVEVFGRWQTEEYMPPLVVDGKVPRNEYGNVEMFKPSMLPVGGAHIKIDGIQKVARKLGIDFAPAMVGWDFHGGFSHPKFEGIVVAEEFEEVLHEAWETEEQLSLEKQMKKTEERVLAAWKRLVKGVLIKERVRARFEDINS